MADQLIPSQADVYQFLIEKFTDEDLESFCFQYFRPVQADFTTGMTRGQKIRLLLTYCINRDLWPSLTAALQKTRPDQYGQLVIEQPFHLELVRVPAGEFTWAATQRSTRMRT